VRIRYAGERCAPSAFLDTLKSEYEFKAGNGVWRSIRIDHEVYSVRYLSGIRDEFVLKMGLKLPEAYAVEGKPAPFNLLTDVDAGGDVDAEVSNVTQNNYFSGESPGLLSEARNRWVKELCSQLARFLSTGHMMVVVNHGNREAQDAFWRYLWQDGLERLVPTGLLLVHMIDISDETTRVHNLAPAANVEINLPTAFGPNARDQAIDDLTGIIVREIPKISAEAAHRAAHALVSSHVDDIPRLHRASAAYLMTLGKEFG
jgi:hypothetical protein